MHRTPRRHAGNFSGRPRWDLAQRRGATTRRVVEAGLASDMVVAVALGGRVLHEEGFGLVDTMTLDLAPGDGWQRVSRKSDANQHAPGGHIASSRDLMSRRGFWRRLDERELVRANRGPPVVPSVPRSPNSRSGSGLRHCAFCGLNPLPFGLRGARALARYRIALRAVDPPPPVCYTYACFLIEHAQRRAENESSVI